MSKKKTFISVSVTEKFTLEQLAEMLAYNIRNEDMPRFIAMLDKNMQDWGVTEELISHYKHLDILRKEHDPEELKPKEIKF